VVLEEEAPHVVTTYTGEEWLARNRGGFGSGGQMHDPNCYPESM
jgi:hypothetical protein